MMDTAFLSFYSVGLFVSGSLCDHYSPKHLLIVSYVLVTIVATLISQAADAGLANLPLFCALFSVNGLLQSIGWPACTVVFANWFGKRGRGTLIGLWCSCPNAGNIGGALITSFLTSTLLLNWRWAYMIVSWFCLLMALVNVFGLIVHPSERGLVIEEIDDQLNETERLLADQPDRNTASFRRLQQD